MGHITSPTEDPCLWTGRKQLEKSQFNTPNCTWGSQTQNLLAASSQSPNTTSQSAKDTFTGFIDWEEWAEYEKDNNSTKALQQPENISQAGNRHRTKWATERDQHVSLHHGSRRERFPFPSPPSTSQIRCMRFCCLLKGSLALAAAPSGSDGPPQEPDGNETQKRDGRTSAN